MTMLWYRERFYNMDICSFRMELLCIGKTQRYEQHAARTPGILRTPQEFATPYLVTKGTGKEQF